MSRVHELLERTRQDVESRKAARPLSIQDVPQDDRRIRWSKNQFHLITEIKRSSLSAGSIRPDLQIVELATSFQRAGASAISVLTEPHYFHGSLEDLRAVRRAVSVPVLQKDFILDPYQILEAKVAGADFVLLIARFLSTAQLAEFHDLCNTIRINALIEITDESELAKLPGSVPFLGVNARNLETLDTDTSRFSVMRPALPDTFLIAESGIRDEETLREVVDLSYNGALIGEHLLKSEDPGKEAAILVTAAATEVATTSPSSNLSLFTPARSGDFSRSRTLVKICGITNEGDARMAVEAGADALGFIFARSARQIDPEVLLRFRHRIPRGVLAVGVFRGQPQHEVERVLQQFSFDIAQVYEPMDLPVPTWQSRIFAGVSDLERTRDISLFDLKLEGEFLTTAWEILAHKGIFGLAGNLHSGNVEKAIAICRPQWVDVARGVETSPGIKDGIKLKEFIKRAHSGGPACRAEAGPQSSEAKKI